jgi:hypothetical protein
MKQFSKTCSCGRLTNYKDGICVICKQDKEIEMAVPGQCSVTGCESKVLKEGLCYKCFVAAKGYENLPKSMKSRKKFDNVCIDCKKDYQSISNQSKRCPVCKHEHKKKIDREKKKSNKQINVSSIPINIIPQISLPSSPVQNPITVDFSDYPELLDFLLKTAKESFRSPELLLIYFINIAKSNPSALQISEVVRI